MPSRTLAITCLLALGAASPAAEPREVPVQKRNVATKTKAVVGADGVAATVTVKEVVPVQMAYKLDPAKCAVVICDVWDDHWCTSAAKRCDALAKQAGPVVDALRKQGMTIVHAPSDCMAYYKDHAARKRTVALKAVETPKPLDLPDPPLPIDDKDGGCDDDPPAKFRKAWTKQHDAVAVDAEKDFVTDSGKELYAILKDRGLDTVIVMGVHTNMCVLHRSFAIKQLRRWDVPCLLVRDLTDAMYNPKSKPFVTHDEGTQLVIGFIEENWCPTVLSKDLVGK